MTARRPLTEGEHTRIEKFLRKYRAPRLYWDERAESIGMFIHNCIRRWESGKRTYIEDAIGKIFAWRGKHTLKARLAAFVDAVQFITRFERNWRKVRNLYE